MDKGKESITFQILSSTPSPCFLFQKTGLDIAILVFYLFILFEKHKEKDIEIEREGEKSHFLVHSPNNWSQNSIQVFHVIVIQLLEPLPAASQGSQQ